MEGERQRVKEIEYVLVRVLFRIRSPQDCFQDRPCNRIQEAFSSEPCLGYVLFNIVLRHVVTINIVLYTHALAQAANGSARRAMGSVDIRDCRRCGRHYEIINISHSDKTFISHGNPDLRIYILIIQTIFRSLKGPPGPAGG